MQGDNHHHCPASSCASSCVKIANISYPFGLQTEPPNCMELMYNLSCENNSSTILHLYSRKYYVQEINYNNYTIHLVDFNIVGNDIGNCSSIPNYSMFDYNFIYQDPYYLWKEIHQKHDWYHYKVSFRGYNFREV